MKMKIIILKAQFEIFYNLLTASRTVSNTHAQVASYVIRGNKCCFTAPKTLTLACTWTIMDGFFKLGVMIDTN